MRYFLKKDLPGIKAGAEMEKAVLHSSEEINDSYIFQPGEVIEFSVSILQGAWKSKESDAWHRIPNSELSDWIEERADGMWKPKDGEEYFFPVFDGISEQSERCYWGHGSWHSARFFHGLVCPTPKLAIELTDRMIETAKKFWQEKE